MKKIDVYSMQIILKYLKKEEDFINVVLVNSKFKEVLDRLRTNTIQVTRSSRKLFQCIQTQHVFSKYDFILNDIQNYVIDFCIDYHTFLKKQNFGVVWKRIKFTSHDHEEIGNQLPDCIHIIDDYAFESCDFETINLPSSLTEIRRCAFRLCSNLKELIIPNSVEVLGDSIFYECTSLCNISLSTNIKVLPENLFGDCRALKTIHIPSSITQIGNNCFENCDSISEIVIPNSVIHWGENCFCSCESLTSVILYGQKVIPNDCFSRCNNLISVEFDTSLERIGNKSFFNCMRLSKINLVTSLKEIGTRAFSWCNALKQIDIPSSVNYIGEGAFSNCLNLTRLVIHNDQCYIEEHLFDGCDSLVQLKLPLINNIYPSATNDHENDVLKNNHILSKAKIHSFHFNQNTNSIIFDNNTEKIEELRIDIPTNITSFYLSSSITSFQAEYLFDNINIKELVLSSLSDDRLISILDIKNVTRIVLPSTLKVIHKDSFSYYSIKEIHIPNSVTRIEDHSFYSCKLLESLFIPSSVQSYGSYVLEDCQSLKQITFENKDFVIENEITYEEYTRYIKNNIKTNKVVLGSKESSLTQLPNNCSVLIYGFLPSLQLNEIPPNVIYFNNISFLNNQLTSLTVPSTVTSFVPYCLSTLRNLKELSLYKNTISSSQWILDSMTSLERVNLIDGSLDDMVVSYDSSLRMRARGVLLSNIKWNENDELIYGRRLTINEEEISVFKDNLHSYKSLQINHPINPFEFHSFFYLRTVELSDEIKEIPNCCFFRCYSLSQINIPNQCTSIGMFAFKWCESLTSLSIPSNIKILEDGAFYGCTNLKEVNINNNIKIGFDTFGKCVSLEFININGVNIKEYPYEVTYQQMKQFENIGILCSNVVLQSDDIKIFGRNIINDEHVKRIDDCCFKENKDLHELIIPKHIKRLGKFSFKDCVSLKSITIPSSITLIPYCCFDGCLSLENVELPNSILFEEHCFCKCFLIKGKSIPHSFIDLPIQ
ncbi:leucine rich repeat protein, BspA family protein [Entamoeba histolytica HM-1:IMSS-B]|uniref:Leucine rich repeat protein, BspA family n=6 Tax=Entamoeba histolytica TaxID=5759 RepID=C4LTX8_ENTH1|nr:uncharacterized protein EHI_051080 [Entamoeba histolytica HM-1:IMSS]EMD43085.1 leucine rich repeatcontaining protein BspA family protein [Entamoeba histolytica KU27]EMH76090.1 leucine rich repeat protein, BspA family protein [Entamoeba histolytica HM-1:IMSS-B]EMS17848.1 leucine rich repeat protein, bspa family protein [Entamoeba histolytica HM-3:IMSS]ENY66039.1 leucine rich repeat protein, bspa family protein [Entamoeba histolytica HM-1:IMSS-A]GAT92039.1 leucine rich repeat protein bspa fam|eukprot:XP_652986.2 uncharacterized protein EHI_051080 [Entamoeba histolytica HM-1:IMSS]